MPLSLTINGLAIGDPRGRSIFDCAEDAGIRVPTSCHKNGRCKECMIEVMRGAELISPKTPAEAHLSGNFRLSCQCQITAEEGEVSCHTMRRGKMRIERGGEKLAGADDLPLEPCVTRDGKRILLDGEEIDYSSAPIHGIAIDLGTTTIVVRLFNLETGQRIADTAFENPQRFGGSDVMSRIQYDTTHPGRLLMRTVAGYLSHAIEALPVDPKSIYEVVVVGNSTMRDLFFRQSVYTIGQNPYRSITEIELSEGKRTTTSLTMTGKQALLPIHTKARVYGAPIISGHVGADAAACMLAIDLAREDRIVCLMDIGTNTELVLGNKDRILAASCPAGPAFEGGAITCGMPGLEGAIEDVVIDDNGDFKLRIIEDSAPSLSFPRRTEGGNSPLGICGSGLIALMGELLRTGRMNELGRFEDGLDPLVLDQSARITFHERDVNELAQAKGANVAGLNVVLDRYGIDVGDIDIFYLAGGFGRHLRLDCARRIGLIPDLPEKKLKQIGNAAIEGAQMALLSRSKRLELERLVRRVEHCRLETHPQFFDFFVEGCQFRPFGTQVQACSS